MEKRGPPWNLIGGLFFFIKKNTAVCKNWDQNQRKTNGQFDFFGLVIWMFNLLLEASVVF